MRRDILRSLLLMALLGSGGCGTTLQQIRAMPPLHEKHINKDANCVYSKTKSFAFGNQPHFLLPQFIWQSNWDETEKSGEIFAAVEGCATYPIIFKISEERDGTRIGVTYVTDAQHLGRFREFAMEIFNGTDYSRCADTPITHKKKE